MEMAVLMERMHCIYGDAFSPIEGYTKSRVLGVQRKEYFDALREDDLIPYLKAQLAKKETWVDITQQRHCTHRGKPLYQYLTEGSPIFDQKCLGKVNEEIMKQLGKNDFIKGLRNHDADQDQETEIAILGTVIISNFIQGSKTPVVGLVMPKNDRKGTCEDPHNLLTPDVRAPYLPKQIPITLHKKRPPDVLVSPAAPHRYPSPTSNMTEATKDIDYLDIDSIVRISDYLAEKKIVMTK